VGRDVHPHLARCAHVAALDFGDHHPAQSDRYRAMFG
jgi:hypothetical protein